MVKSVVEQYKDLFYKKDLDYQIDLSGHLSESLKKKLHDLFHEEINEQKPRGHRVFEIESYKQKRQALINDFVSLVQDQTYNDKEIIKFFLEQQVSNFTTLKLLYLIKHARREYEITSR